jgi:hypothetical protein
MAGLVPAIHVFFISTSTKDVDARHKAGHDENYPPCRGVMISISSPALSCVSAQRLFGITS